jgi:hypothetical protein
MVQQLQSSWEVRLGRTVVVIRGRRTSSQQQQRRWQQLRRLRRVPAAGDHAAMRSPLSPCRCRKQRRVPRVMWPAGHV